MLLGASALARTSPASAQIVEVTTTTYARDADGALTAVTTQVDDAPATTVYLTWDDFVPDASNPTTGTVTTGNGNLLGYGPSPGTSALTAQFQYDPRNRLVSATVPGSPSVAYTYYPASRLASTTLASGDSLQFFWDSARIQNATNIYQPSTGTWSSYLDAATYLTDGTEQVRLQPRKDVAGVYTASDQSVVPVAYDPYGATTSATTQLTSTYDMTQNPFQYAGELQDPVWNGYYLQARWYFPALETFLSRDPVDAVHRYGYADGNPIGNTDPTGLRSGYYRDFGRYLQRGLKPLTSGAPGLILPLFLGAQLGPLQILANPGAFWHAIKTDSHGTDIFLAANIAAEMAGQRFSFAFTTKLGLGSTIGFAQAIAAGENGPNRHYNARAFGETLEYAANLQAEARYADARYHFEAPSMSADKVNDVVSQFLDRTTSDTEAIAFRAFPRRPSGPIEEWWQQGRGPQDEYLVSISKRAVRISGRNDYYAAQFARTFDPTLMAIENIQGTPASLFDLDFTTRGYRVVGTFEETPSNLAYLRAEDGGRSVTKYIKSNVTGERPNPIVRGDPTTFSARYALRMREKLGLSN